MFINRFLKQLKGYPMRKWIEDEVGRHTLDIGLFTITVGWRNTKKGFAYAYLTVKSSEAYGTLDECKWMAVKSAKQRIKETWKNLQ